ncbi:hypothetical protein B0H12DRAFT_330545 [Mycena haematopus]|nr:hypothetical protein B0H12DRAFT_330545 [Mycena haematopus]
MSSAVLKNGNTKCSMTLAHSEVRPVPCKRNIYSASSLRGRSFRRMSQRNIFPALIARDSLLVEGQVSVDSVSPIAGAQAFLVSVHCRFISDLLANELERPHEILNAISIDSLIHGTSVVMLDHCKTQPFGIRATDGAEFLDKNRTDSVHISNRTVFSFERFAESPHARDMLATVKEFVMRFWITSDCDSLISPIRGRICPMGIRQIL